MRRRLDIAGKSLTPGERLECCCLLKERLSAENGDHTAEARDSNRAEHDRPV